MKQNKNGRCFLFRFFSKQTMKHGDLLNDLPNPCNCETSLLSRTTHFTSKLISFSNFFLHRRSGYKDFYFEILVVQRWHILLLNFSDYFFFLRLRSQTGTSQSSRSPPLTKRIEALGTRMTKNVLHDKNRTFSAQVFNCKVFSSRQDSTQQHYCSCIRTVKFRK